ncbi:ATP-binding protein [Streptomyces fuscigenes]|uniref:ATP-binding protein n=1 Tax=Streptomyces fuscigenes TaxID=1528880 RepID=UPI0027E135F0|nr:ATP-binding protein [Streptomyces fuscigenes]
MISDIHPFSVAEHTYGVQLSSTGRGARLARLLAVERVRAWGLAACLDATAQVVAELASNAVTHGLVPGRDFRMTLAVTADVLRIEVTDARHECLPPAPARGHSAAAPVSGGEQHEGGRGLRVVEAFADRWGVTPGPDDHGGAAPSTRPYKTVWAEIRLGPGASVAPWANGETGAER